MYPNNIISRKILASQCSGSNDFAIYKLFLEPCIGGLFIIIFYLFGSVIRYHISCVRQVLRFRRFHLYIFFCHSAIYHFGRFADIKDLIAVRIFYRETCETVIFPFRSIHSHGVFYTVTPIRMNGVRREVVIFSFHMNHSIVRLFAIELIIAPVYGEHVVTYQIVLPAYIKEGHFVSCKFIIRDIHPAATCKAGTTVIFRRQFVVREYQVTFTGDTRRHTALR